MRYYLPISIVITDGNSGLSINYDTERFGVLFARLVYISLFRDLSVASVSKWPDLLFWFSSRGY